MARFIDLDEIAPDPVRVKLNDVIYQLPGDIPIPDYIALDELARRALVEDDMSEMNSIFDDISARLLGLFQEYQPDLEALPVGPRTLLPLVLGYLNGTDASQPEPDDAVPPPRGGTRTKRSTSPRSKTTTTSTRRRASVS